VFPMLLLRKSHLRAEGTGRILPPYGTPYPDRSLSPDLCSHKFKAHKIRRSVGLDPQVAPDPPLLTENTTVI
jgi:hypothetical protein